MSLDEPSDTSPDVRRVHLEILRRAGPARRLRAGLDLSRSAIALSRAGLRRSRPGVPEREVLLEWVALHYGTDVATGVRRRLEQLGRAG